MTQERKESEAEYSQSKQDQKIQVFLSDPIRRSHFNNHHIFSGKTGCIEIVFGTFLHQSLFLPPLVDQLNIISIGIYCIDPCTNPTSNLNGIGFKYNARNHRKCITDNLARPGRASIAFSVGWNNFDRYTSVPRKKGAGKSGGGLSRLQASHSQTIVDGRLLCLRPGHTLPGAVELARQA